ncbi:MAG: L,D-transpeptidase family protein [Marinoscillum sp.]
MTPLITFGQSDEDIQTEIRLKIEALRGSGLMVKGEPICCGKSISNFYTNRFFEPIWTNMLRDQLIREVKACADDGLNPEDYHLQVIEEMTMKSDLNYFEQAGLELLLTDSFFLLASHLMSGKVNPATLNTDWKVNRREGDPVELMTKALLSEDIPGALNEIRPIYKAYNRLKEQLKVYQELQAKGGWATLEEGSTLKLGDQGNRVLAVRDRLKKTGDLLPYTNDQPEVFDEELEAAIKHYQKRHGLEVDGALGKGTIQSMNVPVEDRIEDIILNLERSRWLPQDLGDHYIMVNLPAFELEVVKDSQVNLEMEVAVGKPYRQTPVFSSNMTYMVVNPYWTVPPTILFQDMIPAQAKKPNYLTSLNIKVLNSAGAEVNPSEIDWAGIKGRSFPYTLRQEPGPNNALGQVKFIFPNEYNIYMHDTNHRELFVKAERALSSGCIRLSRPMDFAYYLSSLQARPLGKVQVDEIVKSKSNQTIILSKPLRVHMQYWTSFVDERGVLNFRKDVYNRDERLKTALASEPTL